jgi:hypothetical protein
MFERAIGIDVRLIRVLLTASDTTARARLTGRELGSELEDGLRTSAERSRLLDSQVPSGAVRIATDERSVVDVAREVVAAAGWT